MNKKFVIWILTLTGVLGYLLVSLYTFEAARQKEQDKNRNTDLVEVITNQEAEIELLEVSIEETRLSIDEQRRQQTEGVGRLNSLRASLDNARLFSGLTELTGKGLVVTVNDNLAKAELAKQNQGAGYNPNDFLIHDKNLLYLVNELKSAQPDGISINGQRLVTDSNIRCVGTVVLVNDTRLSPPYIISLVGNPEQLKSALDSSEEYQFLISQDFPVTWVSAEQVVLPPYRGNYAPAVMQPLRQESNVQHQVDDPAYLDDASDNEEGES